MIKMLQERAGCKMQMIQDGPYASAPEKPLRMTGFADNCKVRTMLLVIQISNAINCYITHCTRRHMYALVQRSLTRWALS